MFQRGAQGGPCSLVCSPHPLPPQRPLLASLPQECLDRIALALGGNTVAAAAGALLPVSRIAAAAAASAATQPQPGTLVYCQGARP